MPDEHLVDFVVGDFLSGQPFVATGPDIEQELVTVPQLDQPTRGGLSGPGTRHAGSESDHTHFVGRQRFRTGLVDVKFIGNRYGRPCCRYGTL